MTPILATAFWFLLGVAVGIAGMSIAVLRAENDDFNEMNELKW